MLSDLTKRRMHGPAVRAGLLTALIRRGPWGTIQQRDPEADAITTMRIDSLAELPEAVVKFNAGER